MRMDHENMTHGGMDHGMAMAFTTSCHVMPLLFNSWNIHNCGTLAGACVGVFLLGVLYEGVKVLREHVLLSMMSKMGSVFRECTCGDRETEMNVSVTRLSQERKPHKPSCARSQEKINLVQNPTGKMCTAGHAVQSVMYTIQLALAYILMLIAMTYNVYLFTAVCVGAGAGYFLFAWKRKSVGGLVEEEHCH